MVAITVDNFGNISELNVIPTLFIDDQPIHSAKDKANALNSHFKSVFTEENLSTLPTMDSHADVPSMRPHA